jgi:hypothetical protein
MTTLSKLSNRQVLFLLVSMAIISVFASGIANSTHADGDWLAGLFSNLGTEMVGAVLTYVLFEIIIGERQKQEEKTEASEARKLELMSQLRSQVNPVALQAIEAMRPYGWLKDGSLKGADLHGANLEGAPLAGTNLQEASLVMTKLKGARLAGANLRGANMMISDLRDAELTGISLQRAHMAGANLQGVDLARASLQEANLTHANLQGVGLVGTSLQGAYLEGTNLQGAHLHVANLEKAFLVDANLQGITGLETAQFDEATILPNSSKWTPGTDLSRFTDSNHPNFWRSDNPKSPAYKGKSEND